MGAARPPPPTGPIEQFRADSGLRSLEGAVEWIFYIANGSVATFAFCREKCRETHLKLSTVVRGASTTRNHITISLKKSLFYKTWPLSDFSVVDLVTQAANIFLEKGGAGIDVILLQDATAWRHLATASTRIGANDDTSFSYFILRTHVITQKL
jgi:hypothetical protein